MRPLTRISDSVPLRHLAILRIAGPDAASFLQGQLTSDTRLLADGRTQLAGCTTPQGRVIALLRLRQTDGAICALLPRDLVETVAQHLRRFVFRAKVTLAVASDLEVWRVGDEAAIGSANELTFDFIDGRRLVAAAPDAWQSAEPGVSSTQTGCADDDWRAADIAAGLPQVFAAASEAFIPQMLNLDLLGAVSFDKGCYTGQEIVARTQHLGRIKRRTFRYRLARGPDLVPLAGLHLDGVKVAEVLDAVSRQDGVELLAVASLEARGKVLASDDGREATPLELPYAVPAGA